MCWPARARLKGSGRERLPGEITLKQPIRFFLHVVIASSVSVGALRAQTPIPEPPTGLSLDPEAQGFADLSFAQAMVDLADKDYAAALPLLQKAAVTYPSDATYEYFLGICQLRLGRYDEAIASLGRTLPPASNRVPEARVHYDLGDASYKKGDLDRAEKEFRSCVRLEDQDGAAHFYLGLTLFARQDSASAFHEFERAQALDPSLRQQGSYFVAIEAYQRGDFAAARSAFENALQGTPAQALSASTAQWIEALDRPRAPAPPPFVEFRVGLSFERDSNPSQINEIFRIPENQADAREVLDLRAAINPRIHSAGWTLGLVLNGYGSRHSKIELREADLDGAQIVFQVARGSNPLAYMNGPLGYVRVPEGPGRLGFLFQGGASYFDRRNSSFRRDYDAAASLVFQEPRFGRTQAEATYSDRTYFDPGVDPSPELRSRSGHALGLRVGQYFELGRYDRYLRVAVSQTDTSARISELDYTTRLGIVEVAFPATKRWRVFLFGSRGKDDYRRVAGADQFVHGREDTLTSAGISAVFSITRHFYATVRYTYGKTEVRSKDPISDDPLDALSYTRNIESAGLTYSW